MRRHSLTASSKVERGRIVHEYEWEGRAIEVFDSARNMLLVIELFGDEDLLAEEKEQLLPLMLFPDPEGTAAHAGPGYADMLATVLWDACGLDIKDAHECEAKAFDWDEDAARIKASLMSAYHIDWDAARDTLTFADMCDLLSELFESDSETPFQQAIYYRTADEPEPTSGNEEYLKAWRARKRHFALRVRPGAAADEMTAQNNNARDLVLMLKEAAKGGCHG